MKEIPLTQGKIALVSDCDYDRVSQYKWYASFWQGRYYARRSVGKNKKERLHRFILGITDPEVFVDHRDGNTLNCCRENLRACSPQENSWNRAKILREDTSSPYKGVHWDQSKGMWAASIRYDGEYYSLGYFDDEIDAAEAYDEQALFFFGQFARLNFNRNNYES
jgi:hypothetical protein